MKLEIKIGYVYGTKGTIKMNSLRSVNHSHIYKNIARFYLHNFKILIGSVSDIIKRKIEYMESYEQNENSTQK
jgi:hypothetical protein